jgi:hypothetical protein
LDPSVLALEAPLRDAARFAAAGRGSLARTLLQDRHPIDELTSFHRERILDRIVRQLFWRFGLHRGAKRRAAGAAVVRRPTLSQSTRAPAVGNL